MSADPARHRPGPVGADNAIASAALLALTLATAVAMSRVFADWAFLRPLVMTALVVHAIGFTLRALRVHALIALPAAAVGLAEVLAVLFYRDTMRYLLPTRDTIRALKLDVNLVWDAFPSAIPPVPSHGPYVVAAAIGIGLVALLSDAFAFRAYGRAEAVVPAGVLFIFTGALGIERHRVAFAAIWIAIAVLAVALLRALHTRRDVAWLGRRGRLMTSALPATAACAAIAGIAAAVIAPALPGAGADALLDTRHRRGGTTEVISPLVSIRPRLISNSNSEMFVVDAPTERYWRLAGLSTYNGEQWEVPDGAAAPAASQLPGAAGASVTELQRFRIVNMGGPLVPAAYQPVRVTSNDFTALFVAEIDTVLTDDDRLRSGDRFDVLSDVGTPTVAELRAATSLSPPGPAFLDLPENFPNIVRTLAIAITAGHESTYDKAIALQTYFRTQFDYDLNVEFGTSENAMVSFLRLKRGYCAQFAGTFAAMARSIGIPARVAVGFTPGIREADGLLHVYGKQAHAWPELWFDGIGWVLFEPTPGRGAPGAEYTGVPAAQDVSPIVPTEPGQGGDGEVPVTETTAAPASTTPSTGSVAVDPGPIDENGPLPLDEEGVLPLDLPEIPPAPGQRGLSTTTWLLIIGAGLLAWPIVVPTLVRRFTGRHRGPNDTVISAWHSTVGSLELAGASSPGAATPLEYAARVGDEIAIDPRGLNELAAAVTRAVYGSGTVEPELARRAVELHERLEASARMSTPWHLRLLTRFNPRLIRQRFVG